MKPRPFLEAARRFLIWRYGTAVDWDCTYRDISGITGINPTAVARICKKYDYPAIHFRARETSTVQSVDAFMSTNRRLSLT